MKRIALAACLAATPAIAQPVAPDVSGLKVALLVDLGANQVLFAKAPDQQFLPASVTKAMTTLVAFDLIARGTLTEDATVAVAPETARRWSGKGTSLDLQPDQRVLVRDLLLGVTTASANDASVALAEHAAGSVDAWLGLMNQQAATLGMRHSRFATVNGWPDRGATYVTARDLIPLAEALIYRHPELYSRYIGHPAIAWQGRVLANHDPFAGVVAGADGIKTGHTFEAGFNFLGTVERERRRLVVVVAGAPTETERANASRALIEWGFANWRSQPLYRAGDRVTLARVQDGARREVPLTVARDFTLALLVTSGAAGQASARVHYRGPLPAPLPKGAQVATLEIRIPGQPPHSLPLVTAEAVQKAGPIDRVINALLGIWS